MENIKIIDHGFVEIMMIVMYIMTASIPLALMSAIVYCAMQFGVYDVATLFISSEIIVVWSIYECIKFEILSEED